MIAIKNVLVATDFSPVSDVALVYGRELVKTFGGTLHLLHVVQNLSAPLLYTDAPTLTPPVELQAELERAARKQLEALLPGDDRRGLKAITILKTSGSTAKAITDYAKEAHVDLIIVGATGRGAFDRALLGSVADKVIRRATCPVLAVRHPEHEFVLPDVVMHAAQEQG